MIIEGHSITLHNVIYVYNEISSIEHYIKLDTTRYEKVW